MKRSFGKSTVATDKGMPSTGLLAWISPLHEEVNRQWGIALVAMKGELAYRFEFFTAITGTLLTTILLYFLWTAVYESAVSMELAQQTLITYVVVGQAFSFARLGQRRVITRISRNIRTGNVALDLLRPSDYQLLHFSDTLAIYAVETLLVSLPAYGLGLLLFGIDLPVSWPAALGFVASLAAAFLLIFTFDFFIGLLSFWSMSAWGITYAKIAVVDVLAGTIIPLSLFPGWLEQVATILPFRGLAYVPLAIYTGMIEGAAIWTNILSQLAWAGALILLTRLLWLRARQRLVIQGG